MPTAMGARATTVPVDVPMEMEMKQQTMNSPTSSRLLGSSASPRFTVESTAPMPSATLENAPASRKMSTMSMIFSFPAPRVMMPTFSFSGSFGLMHKATMMAMMSATGIGIAVKSPVMMPVPINNRTKTNNGSRATGFPL